MSTCLYAEKIFSTFTFLTLTLSLRCADVSAQLSSPDSGKPISRRSCLLFHFLVFGWLKPFRFSYFNLLWILEELFYHTIQMKYVANVIQGTKICIQSLDSQVIFFSFQNFLGDFALTSSLTRCEAVHQMLER